MDLHTATAADKWTHLTNDAENTLCGQVVTDLPRGVKEYCWRCIDLEFDLGAKK